jgi:hypothetical protein
VDPLSDTGHSTATGEPLEGWPGDQLPAGEHPLEIAARQGFGPLSPMASEVWHGGATPCVSCGQLVRRDDRRCQRCGQDLSPRMIEKMRAHAGPWFVYEHLRPFPGVSLERIIRQLRRGLLTETSIVRGPATDYQWRFVVQTPGLCRYFGKCWSCHGQVSPGDTYCPLCLTYLTFEKPRAATPQNVSPVVPTTVPVAPQVGLPPAGGSRPALVPPVLPVGAEPPAAIGLAAGRWANESAQDLQLLRAALEEAPRARHDDAYEGPPTLLGIRFTWLAVGLLLIAVLVLLVFTQYRSRQTDPAEARAPVPTVQGLIVAS